MSAIYLIDGKPHRECECDTMSEVCPKGRKRGLQTCGFGRCLLPAPDVLTTATPSETGTWIAFKDRMPDEAEHDYVLATTGEEGDMEIYMTDLACQYANDNPPLTHWMPLPRKP